MCFMLNEREVWSLDQIINERGVRGDTKFSTGLDAEDHRMATAAEIAEQLGLTPTGKGGYTGFCPSCCYETGFSVIDKDGKTLFHCHAGGCSQQEIIGWVRKYGLWDRQPSESGQFPLQRPAPTSKTDSTEAALAIWQRSEPATGTVVETYLRARGYRGEIPMALRYVTGRHPA